MWLFPTVVEFMSGELVASAEALVTSLAGERFLRQEKCLRYNPLTTLADQREKNLNISRYKVSISIFVIVLFDFQQSKATYQSCVFAKMSL